MSESGATTANPSALVTGGSRGIGYGIAAHLAAQNWSLTLVARNVEQLTQARGDLEALGATVQIVSGDMADDHALNRAVDAHESAYGSMSALILAAGVGSAGPLENYPMRRFDKQFAVNVRAPYALVSRALPLLRAAARHDPARGARVIALTSVEGVYPEAGLSAYGASKAALVSLIRSVNLEEAANGVFASAVSPGFVATDMSAWTADTIPLDTMISVADVVKVVDLVLSLSVNSFIPHIIVNRTGGGPYHA
ncbi:MAG: 3-oxoacyl-[acyl-carrier-protein] reductase FabG [Pseudonocardiales bacterium]|nr:3-oxoacyl-[acyl-carrier-protein] reductase FabG [Pseudonocardiales bacterium]